MTQTMQDIMNPNARNSYPAFPDAPDDWSPGNAEQTAAAEGVALTDDHWSVIRALQSLFAGDPSPSARSVHDALDEHFHDRGGLKYLYGLLPGGPIAQGCRLAGLGTPAGAVDASFGSVQ
jgi:tRNA 2-thiouridine synthesizing protein E